MRITKVFVIAMALMMATMFGGIITDGVKADEQVSEEVIAEEVVVEEVEEELPEEPEEVEVIEEVEEEQPITTEDIIARDTGLIVDYIAVIDSYPEGEWYAYYIHADGDCYALTIKRGSVDVCAILN